MAGVISGTVSLVKQSQSVCYRVIHVVVLVVGQAPQHNNLLVLLDSVAIGLVCLLVAVGKHRVIRYVAFGVVAIVILRILPNNCGVIASTGQNMLELCDTRKRFFVGVIHCGCRLELACW